jgi:hypothetical protein
MLLSFLTGFIAGMIVGASALLFIASRFVDKAKPQARPDGIAAVGMDLNGNGEVTIDVWHARMMRDVIERIEGRA